MHIINIDNKYIFKTKSLYLNCYSVNSTVWKHLDEYAVLIYVNRNYYKQFTISCEDVVMHYNKPLNTAIKTGLGLGEINQSAHAEHLRHARQLIQQLIG